MASLRAPAWAWPLLDVKQLAAGDALVCDGQLFARCGLCGRLHVHGAAGGPGLRVCHGSPTSRGSYALRIVGELDASRAAALSDVWQADARAAWLEIGRAVRARRRGAT